MHDDDIFTYNFYRQGKLVDGYNLVPIILAKFPDEEKPRARDVRVFAGISGQNQTPCSQLKSLLSAGKENYVFESQRLEEFITLLALPNAMGSYDYLGSGEDDNIEGRKKFIHLQGAEKPKPKVTGEMYDSIARIKLSQGDGGRVELDFYGHSDESRPRIRLQ